MAAFAPSIRRGDFLYYRGCLSAVVDDNHNHPRATPLEIALALDPSLCEHDVPCKEPYWHWYAAQFIHCGLTVPKTKNKKLLKKGLLKALSGFRPVVPDWILELETELKTEWDSENEKISREDPSTSAVVTTISFGGDDHHSVGSDSHWITALETELETEGDSNIERTLRETPSTSAVVNTISSGGDDHHSVGSAVQTLPFSHIMKVNSESHIGNPSQKDLSLMRTVGKPVLSSSSSDEKLLHATPAQRAKYMREKVEQMKRKTKAEETADDTPPPKKVAVARGSAMSSGMQTLISAPTRGAVNKSVPARQKNPPPRAPKAPASPNHPYQKAIKIEQDTLSISSVGGFWDKPSNPSSAGGYWDVTCTSLIGYGITSDYGITPGGLLSGYGIPAGGLPSGGLSGETLLSIYHDPTRDVCWAHVIQSGVREFVIKMKEAPRRTTVQVCHSAVEWRMRDFVAHEAVHGSKCIGTVQFFWGFADALDLALQGVPGLGDVWLFACRRMESGQPEDMQSMWDEFTTMGMMFD